MWITLVAARRRCADSWRRSVSVIAARKSSTRVPPPAGAKQVASPPSAELFGRNPGLLSPNWALAPSSARCSGRRSQALASLMRCRSAVPLLVGLGRVVASSARFCSGSTRTLVCDADARSLARTNHSIQSQHQGKISSPCTVRYLSNYKALLIYMVSECTCRSLGLMRTMVGKLDRGLRSH